MFVQHKDVKRHFENFYLMHMSSKQNQVWNVERNVGGNSTLYMGE